MPRACMPGFLSDPGSSSAPRSPGQLSLTSCCHYTHSTFFWLPFPGLAPSFSLRTRGSKDCPFVENRRNTQRENPTPNPPKFDVWEPLVIMGLQGRAKLGLTLSTCHAQCQHTAPGRDGHRRGADTPCCPIPARFYRLDFPSRPSALLSAPPRRLGHAKKRCL